MDVILKAISTVDSKLASLEQKDGQLIFCKDTRKILLDLNGVRTAYEQITTINTESQRTEILAPVDGFYFVLDTHILWRYSAEWIQITSQPADVVKINQGSSNSGKFLGIGPDGNVSPMDAPEDSVKIDTTLTKTGEAADAKIVGDELGKKINKSGWSVNKFLGTNESGNIIEKDVPEGESIPNGGTTGQVLTKKSDSDKDVGWEDSTAVINKANESDLGGVKVKNATEEQTVFVGIDSDGFLKVNESGTAQVDHGTSDATFALPPNQYHTWGEVASLTLTLGTGASGQANGYWFSFDSGDTATTLSLPETVNTDIVVEPNMHYECSIIGNYMTFEEWEVSA